MDLRGTYNIGGYGTLIVQSGIWSDNTIQNLHAVFIPTVDRPNGSIDLDYIRFAPQSVWISGDISIPGYIDLSFENEEMWYSTALSLLANLAKNNNQASNVDMWLAQALSLRPDDVRQFLSQTLGIRDWLLNTDKIALPRTRAVMRSLNL